MISLRSRREFIGLVGGAALLAQQRKRDYDESKVRAYTLPDALALSNGKPVKSAKEWRDRRRPELLRLFEDNEYGHTLGSRADVRFEPAAVKQDALGGRARRKIVNATVRHGGREHAMSVLVYLPHDARGKTPVFAGMNFRGNHTVTDEPDIPITEHWLPNNVKRGMAASQWPLDRILERGYGLATIYCGDIWPDFKEGTDLGIAPMYYHAGESKRRPDDWGAISAWAWALSRALDYLETDSDVDAKRVAVIGHSRMGKTALWAGAQDERFAMIVSNCSGASGATIGRRRFGESVKEIGDSFPYWFCENYRKFADNEDALPMDQHELLAVSAPRPLYVAVADQDLGSDPRGQWLAAQAASPVYKLLGTDGLAASEMPPPHQPITSRIGFHVRTGKHDITQYDWDRYMDFADKHLSGK